MQAGRRPASGVRDWQVEPAQARGVGEDVDLHDLPASDRESITASSRRPCPRHACGTVHQRGPHGSGSLCEGQRLRKASTTLRWRSSKTRQQSASNQPHVASDCPASLRCNLRRCGGSRGRRAGRPHPGGGRARPVAPSWGRRAGRHPVAPAFAQGLQHAVPSVAVGWPRRPAWPWRPGRCDGGCGGTAPSGARSTLGRRSARHPEGGLRLIADQPSSSLARRSA
jgi:hypothetical protein